jgi:hypothetical protein
LRLERDRQTQHECAKTGEGHRLKRRHLWLIWLWPAVGLFSLIWFLIRVIPKPSRATYPCQRVAFPLASGFVVWLLGLGGSAAAFRKARSCLSRRRYFVAVLCVVVSIGCVLVSLTLTAEKKARAADPHPGNIPIGVGKGVHPGRVVWVHDPNATDWAGPGMGDGHWWQSNHTDQQAVDRMMQRAICALAGEQDIAEAWDLLFRHFNQQQGNGSVGYSSGEKIMIKVNFVEMIAVSGNTDYDFADRSPDYAICAPQIMRALLDQLVNVVEVAESDITIGDPICLWCHEFYNMIQPDFPNVRYLDYLGYYGRTKIQYSGVPFYWSTSKAAGKTQDYVLQSYVDAAYFINLASFKGHYNQAGITLCGKNHYGSLRRPDAGGYYDMHSDSPFNVPQSGSYRNMVDLMGHRHVGGKTFLCLIDGLYGGKHALGYPQNLPRKWQMEPFNDDWPSSIFASQDQVALDSVGFDFLVTEWPEGNGPAHEGTDDYLHEAALANNPASGTFYDPEKDGTRLAGLGVHEHWNNPIDKQYSRNLGIANGIELMKIPGYRIAADIDGDNSVNSLDLAVLSSQWLDRIVYQEAEGQVVMEAERFSRRVAGRETGLGLIWHRTTDNGASAGSCMEALPDRGVTLDANIETDSPRLSYLVNFAAPGTYYLWLKAVASDLESDSVHYGTDGLLLSAGNKDALLNQQSEEVLTSKGAEHWLYLDIGQEQAGWTALVFDDSGWREGQARLGYGKDGEVTEVRYGPNDDNTLNDGNNKYITTYFRKYFTVSNPSCFSSLNLSILRDDGAVAYLNGQEAARSNMPGGPVNYYTIVRDHVVSSGEEDTFFDYEADPQWLYDGNNVVAVEVHQYAPAGQNNITSSDLSFDLELTGRTSFGWRSECADGTRPVIYVPSGGIHTIDIWLREDGVKLDRVLLATDQNYDPADDEPVESPYAPIEQVMADVNADGVVDFVDFGLMALHWLEEVTF